MLVFSKMGTLVYTFSLCFVSWSSLLIAKSTRNLIYMNIVRITNFFFAALTYVVIVTQILPISSVCVYVSDIYILPVAVQIIIMMSLPPPQPGCTN